jgi:3-oxoadipate enol-lactonase
LLLIGGLGFGRWGWFKQVPAFSRHFRTITFDVRGQRRLENGVGDLAGEVVALLDHLGVKKAHPRAWYLARRLCGAETGALEA